MIEIPMINNGVVDIKIIPDIGKLKIIYSKNKTLVRSTYLKIIKQNNWYYNIRNVIFKNV